MNGWIEWALVVGIVAAVGLLWWLLAGLLRAADDGRDE